jgi:predicted nucleic acid-binding protein
MILVDTSVWVDHLRAGDAGLAVLLQRGLVCGHSFVIGELALGNLRQRVDILSLLRDLPPAVVARDSEVLGFIEAHGLAGCGIGYVDAHLLASVRLTLGGKLWTRDKRLLSVAERLGLAFAAVGTASN